MIKLKINKFYKEPKKRPESTCVNIGNRWTLS